jgi:hypothetical protein
MPEEAVALQSTPACLGCQAEELCPIFPEAPPVEAYSPRLPCDEKPLHEQVQVIGPYTATFEDPPGTEGMGYPSGGKHPAIGMLAYSKSSGVGKITCTLADPERDACAAVTLAGITALVAGP